MRLQHSNKQAKKQINFNKLEWREDWNRITYYSNQFPICTIVNRWSFFIFFYSFFILTLLFYRSFLPFWSFHGFFSVHTRIRLTDSFISTDPSNYIVSDCLATVVVFFLSSNPVCTLFSSLPSYWDDIKIWFGIYICFCWFCFAFEKENMYIELKWKTGIFISWTFMFTKCNQ